MKTVTAQQHEHRLANKSANLFIELLRAALASRRAHVTDVEGKEPKNCQAWGWTPSYGGYVSARPNGQRVGWVEGDDLYLEPNASDAVVRELARQQGQGFSVTPQVLRKRLKEAGLLKSIDQTRCVLTIRKTIEGAQRVVLHLAASTVVD